MMIKDGKVIVTQKDIDKGLDKVLTQDTMDKAIQHRFDKMHEDAMRYGDY